MSSSVGKLQREVDNALKQVDDSIRTCVQRSSQVKAAATAEEREKCKDDIKSAMTKLQCHQAQIRKWISQGEVRRGYKERLVTSSARIEKEVKKFHELELWLKANAALPSQAGKDVDANLCSHVSKPGGEPRGTPASCKAKLQEVQLVRDDSMDKELLEEFICKICLVNVVGCGPKMARCSHLFCGDCIATWFAAHPGNKTWAQRALTADGASRTVPCPVCKETLREDHDLYPVCAEGTAQSAMLWRILSSLKVSCANHPSISLEGNCTWTGSYAAYHEHIDTCRNIVLSDHVTHSTIATDNATDHAAHPPYEDSWESWCGSEEDPIISAQQVSEVLVGVSSEVRQTCSKPTLLASSVHGKVTHDLAKPHPSIAVSGPRSQAKQEPEPTVCDTVAAHDTGSRQERSHVGPCDSGGDPRVDACVDTMSDVDLHEDHGGYAGASQPSTLQSALQALLELKSKQHQRAATVTPAATEYSSLLVDSAVQEPCCTNDLPQPLAESQLKERLFRVAIPFATTSPEQLALGAEDLVEIIQPDASGWTFGKKVSALGVADGHGWFPSWAVNSCSS